MMSIALVYEDYLEALRAGDRRRALDVSHLALVTGTTLHNLYLRVFQPAMYEIGRLWEAGQLSAAEEHMATAITRTVMAQLHPFPPTPPLAGRTLVATCPPGEQHDLGLRMVADFFEMAGWSVAYLGADVPIEAVVAMVNSRNADLLAISVTLIEQVSVVAELIAATRASPGGDHLCIAVGGRQFQRRPDLFRAIGADFTAIDARQALVTAQRLLPVL